MSLVRAERRRFFKRRLIKWLTVVGVVVLGVIATAVFFDNQKVSPETVASAQAQAQAEFRSAVQMHEQQLKTCQDTPAGSTKPEFCQYVENDPGPQQEWFRAEYYMPSTFVFKGAFEEMIMVWAAIMAVIAFVIGASFVGAEWSTGSMSSLLTWRPKRMSVLGTKLSVLVGWLTTIGVVTAGLWTAAMWAIAVYRGSTAGMTQGTWQSLGLTGLRGLGLIVAVGVLGFALASLGRHTGVALGVALAVVVVGQIGLTIVLLMLQVPYPEMYLIPTHLQAWMGKLVEVSNPFANPADCMPGQCVEQLKTITWQDTGSITLGVVVVLLVLAFWQMRRRDVS
ncbi:ABC transporter permease subunit [Catellatospora sp. NPDC049609]|uniref:ABC transporter permease subunit n=1 Tax=Catellatospora sp. NPDC049609 TaxID=3155505 RepID=UPI00344582AA